VTKIYLDSAHKFTLREATKSQTAERMNINNQPNVDEIEKLRHVAEQVLLPPRLHFGIPFSPSSWFRTPELCIAIGSRADSQHAKAEAVDFEIPGVDNIRLANWLVNNIHFDQLILECYKPNDPQSGWVHVSCLPDVTKNRREVLTYSLGRYEYGLPDGT
jgi:zinc D-Ala-D-Ala carboxypeptidase